MAVRAHGDPARPAKEHLPPAVEHRQEVLGEDRDVRALEAEPAVGFQVAGDAAPVLGVREDQPAKGGPEPALEGVDLFRVELEEGLAGDRAHGDQRQRLRQGPAPGGSHDGHLALAEGVLPEGLQEGQVLGAARQVVKADGGGRLQDALLGRLPARGQVLLDEPLHQLEVEALDLRDEAPLVLGGKVVPPGEDVVLPGLPGFRQGNLILLGSRLDHVKKEIGPGPWRQLPPAARGILAQNL